MERKIIAKKSQIVDLASYGLPITSTNADKIIDYLFAYEKTNVHCIDKVEATHKLGWTPDMAAADWLMICCRTNSVISVATSTSDICDSAACRFSACVSRLDMVFSSRFWSAPRLARALSLMTMALLIASRADWVSSCVWMEFPAQEYLELYQCVLELNAERYSSS